MNTFGHIRDILQSKGQAAWTIAPEETVYEALRIMAEKNVGALLVTQNNKLIGIITERDYSRKVALMGRSSRNTPVKAILTGKVFYVGPDSTVEECMRLMTENRVRHLPVVQNNEILGVVSIGDLVNWIISAQHSAIQQLETYITGFPTPPA
ncbi:MAG: CBS domain-containing protein [Verrucomicrobia bacterium]|nr:MAG: CBS domain-containing protein [Verrucomicrobiota bacterium]